MKHILMRGFLSAILMLLVLGTVSCNRNSDSQEDENVRYAQSRHYMYSISEEGVFNVMDGLIHFVAEETHEDIIFCADPMCEHEPASSDNPDPVCSAALPELSNHIAYYDGYIYYWVRVDFFNTKIYRIDISSGVREFVAEYPYNFSSLGYAFYEDFLYCNAKIMKEPENDSVLLSYGLLLEVDLKNGGHRVIISADESEESNYAATKFDVCGSTMFALVSDKEEKYLAKINLDTLEETVLIEPENIRERFYCGIYDSDSYYYGTLHEIGICNTATGADKVLVSVGEDAMIFTIIASNRGIFYSVYEQDVETFYFYDVNMGETWDISKQVEKFNINGYDGYMNKFSLSILEENDEDGDGKVGTIGYSVVDVAKVLGEE